MGRKKSTADAPPPVDLSHITEALRPLAVHVDTLTPDPANARTHPEHNLDGIRGSLAVYGQRKPIVVRKGNGVVIAGNGTLAAARSLGWTHLAAVPVDDDAATAAGYAIADNRTAELAGWDQTALDKLLREVSTGNDERLDRMLAELATAQGIVPGEERNAPGAGGDDFDATPDASGPTRSQRGDLWVIGGVHRVLCGDSTKAEDVGRVMHGERAEMVWTDPPYGVGIGDKNKFLNSIAPSNRVEENLENDTLDEPALLAMLQESFKQAVDYCLAGGAWYVAAPAGPLHVIFGSILKELGIWRQTIQWVKNNATFSPMGVDYHWRAEPIFYGWLPNAGHRYHGGRKQDTVWEIDRPMASPDHPTTKPIALVARAIENSSLCGDIVFDPFLGSGTTLVAAHRLNRRCYGLEIEPRYVDVILKRAEAEGLSVERVEAASGLSVERATP